MTRRQLLRAGICLAPLGTLLAAIWIVQGGGPTLEAQAVSITVSPNVPTELNPQGGGAPSATPVQAAAFAWQEFIALNWPAGPQNGQAGQRDTPSKTCLFGDPSQACLGPTVWETFRGKVEIFPGTGNPPGYSAGAPSFGYDALPQYNYANAVPPCSGSTGSAAWVNLDETDQITLDSMYAGVVTQKNTKSSSPQLIRFLAKANRAEYVYVAQNQWWNGTAPLAATKNYVETQLKDPPAGSTTCPGGNTPCLSFPNNVIEVKAGWRVLTDTEVQSGRFHTQTVRFYEGSDAKPCWNQEVWGLVALHIIQKTASAPYFIYATFEQADNILNANGTPVEDVNGKVIGTLPATATSPQTCLNDPPKNQAQNAVWLTKDPAACVQASQSYCTSPQQQLYYQNAADKESLPTGGSICVNRRDFPITDDLIDVNQIAHREITNYAVRSGIRKAPVWLYYKLVNVQYYPYDKIPSGAPNGSPYSSKPPYTAQNPSPSTYYQANIVVETNRSLQIFSGGLVEAGYTGSISDYNSNGSLHKNTAYNGKAYNMGGCMGCHGSQGQSQGGDFSVIMANGPVGSPEVPAKQSPKGASVVKRNRILH